MNQTWEMDPDKHITPSVSYLSLILREVCNYQQFSAQIIDSCLIIISKIFSKVHCVILLHFHKSKCSELIQVIGCMRKHKPWMYCLCFKKFPTNSWFLCLFGFFFSRKSSSNSRLSCNLSIQFEKLRKYQQVRHHVLQRNKLKTHSVTEEDHITFSTETCRASWIIKYLYVFLCGYLRRLK